MKDFLQSQTVTFNMKVVIFRKRCKIEISLLQTTDRNMELMFAYRLHVLGLETLEDRRLIHDLILCYKYLHGLIDTDNRHFWCVQMSPRTRNNCLKLCKAHCNIDVRKAFFTNRVVDIWSSLPAAVVFSHNVSTFKRRLT